MFQINIHAERSYWLIGHIVTWLLRNVCGRRIRFSFTLPNIKAGNSLYGPFESFKGFSKVKPRKMQKKSETEGEKNMLFEVMHSIFKVSRLLFILSKFFSLIPVWQLPTSTTESHRETIRNNIKLEILLSTWRYCCVKYRDFCVRDRKFNNKNSV